jgi:hypothetical protein
MALRDGVLDALVGNLEVQVDTISSTVPGLGHWPWGMSTVSAASVLSHASTHRAPHRRASVGGRYSGERFIACIDAANGSPVWKNIDAELLAAIDAEVRIYVATENGQQLSYAPMK